MRRSCFKPARTTPGPGDVVIMDNLSSHKRASVRERIEAMQREGVRRLLVLPLYPQYSATSTGSVIDAVADTLKALRWPPELRLVNDYHDQPEHIDALEALAGLSQTAYVSLLGMPGFLDYFQQASPVEELAMLKIGSRPARRFGARSLGDLRAIPWVFAWSQNRHMITGWHIRMMERPE